VRQLELEKNQLKRQLENEKNKPREDAKILKQLQKEIEELKETYGSRGRSYQILGVRKDATWEEVKKVYRGLSMTYHPDKHDGAK